MIIGNPDEFALQFDTVAAWNDCGGIFDNGVMNVYVNGENIFKDLGVLSHTLGIELSYFQGLSKLDFSKTASDNFLNTSNVFLKEMVLDGVLQLGLDYSVGIIPISITAFEDKGAFLCFINTSKVERLIWTTDFCETFRYYDFLDREIMKVFIELAQLKL